jgi:hypothetical protein
VKGREQEPIACRSRSLFGPAGVTAGFDSDDARPNFMIADGFVDSGGEIIFMHTVYETCARADFLAAALLFHLSGR